MYGLDKELANKRAAKYSVTDEAAVRNWIGKLLDTPIEGDFGEAMKDGTTLCKLVNTLVPGAIKKINTSTLPFKQMENISSFLQAGRALGLAEFDCFCTPDLFEAKDLGAVVRSLLAFARVVELRPGYSGPSIAEELAAAGSAPPAPAVAEAAPAPAPAVSSPPKASPTATAPARATPTAPAPAPAAAARVVPPKPAGFGGPSAASSPLPKYGLDAELAAKQAAKYDVGMEREAQEWIEAVTGSPFPEGVPFAEALKNGSILCALANGIKPNIIKKVNKPGMPFREMENISTFLQACRTLGVPEADMFSTPDLFEAKGMNQVVRFIHALGRTIQVTQPEYTGPKFGVKMAESHVVSDDVRASWESGVGIPGQLLQGSSATMDRAYISRAGEVDFGARSAGGTGDKSSISKVTQGSAATMDRVYISRASEVDFGARSAGGTGDKASISKVTQGSAGVMDSVHISRAGDITFGHDASAK